MTRRYRWVFTAALVWTLNGPGLEPAKADDIQVNTYTLGHQTHAAVAVDADGNFVVVWDGVGSSATDDSFESIQGQRYAADGSAVGGEFQVNAYTTGRQYGPSVSRDADGDFVVVWTSEGSAGPESIQGQRYASDGSAIGGEFQVNTYTSSSQRIPKVAMDADGAFVVVWQSYLSPGTDISSISVQGRRYASDGSPLGDQFQVNTYTTDLQDLPSVSVDADGDFVVVWRSFGSSGTDSDVSSIQGQRYASDGLSSGGEFQINSFTTSSQSHPSVSMGADGGFVVVWTSGGIQGQRYEANGSAVGGEFQVNADTSQTLLWPEVSLATGGDFAVVWLERGSLLPPGPTKVIKAQSFASDGSAASDEFQVNTYTTRGQDFPWVAMAADGDFIVVWQSIGSTGTDTSGYSIQRFHGGVIFGDGFESGDLSAWN